MSYPNKILEQRFIRLEIEGRCVEVMEYATKDHVQIFLDELSNFDPDFSINYHTKPQIRNMPITNSFLTSTEHCRITEFTFELMMCGNEGCTIFSRIKRKVRTKNVEVNGYSIFQEMILWMDLPVPNTKYRENFIAPAEARQCTNTNNTLFERLKQFMPDEKSDTDERKPL